MALPKPLLNSKLRQYYTEEVFIKAKGYSSPLFVNSYLVERKDKMLLCFQQMVETKYAQNLADDLLALHQMSQHEEFVRLKYLKVIMEEDIIKLSVYMDHKGKRMDQYVKMKSRSDNFVVAQDILWGYLGTMANALVIIESLRFRGHGSLGFHSLKLHKDKLKVMFSPFQLTCLSMLQSRPSLYYFNYYLSPEEVHQLRHQSAQNQLQANSRSDVYTMGILLLNLATLHLLENSCYQSYARVEADINRENIDQKLSFVTQFYSKQFIRVVNSMLLENPQDRLSSLRLKETVRDHMERSNRTRQMYSGALFRIYGENKYKGVTYNIKFGKEGKGKVQDIKVLRKVVESPKQQKDAFDIQFRDTFGVQKEDILPQGQYKAPKTQPVYPEQTEIMSPPKKKEQDTLKKSLKDTGTSQSSKHKKVKQVDEQSTKKKAEKYRSPTKQSELEKGATHLPVHAYNESQQKEQHSYLKPIPVQCQQNHGPNELTKEPSQFSMVQVGNQHEEEYSFSKELLKLPTEPHQHDSQPLQSLGICNKLQNTPKILFEVDGPAFPATSYKAPHGQRVPKRKYFKPQTLAELKNRFNKPGVYISGNVYYGDLKNGRRQGVGLEVFPEGDYYYGWFREDLFHGDGVYWWGDRQYFIGEFHEGQKSHGWMISNDRTYFGTLKNNKKQSIGVSFYPEQIYHGNWHNGLKQGQGTIFYINGDLFKGKWENGKKNGFGVFTRCKRGIQLESMWKDDQMFGNVQVRYPNGDVYRGPYMDNKMAGLGSYVFHNGTKFIGQFRDNHIFQGEFHYCNDGIYKGTVDLNNKRHGYGIYTYTNGDQYKGQWKQGFTHGKGQLRTHAQTFSGTWREGSRWEGTVTNNRTGRTYCVMEGQLVQMGPL